MKIEIESDLLVILICHKKHNKVLKLFLRKIVKLVYHVSRTILKKNKKIYNNLIEK